MNKPTISQIEIGERLRRRREALGLNQFDVAERMKVATSTVQRAEAGTLNATIETLISHCEALELPLAALITAEDVVPKPTYMDVVRSLQAFLRLIEKNPFLTEIATLSDQELKELKQAIRLIKLPESAAVKSRKKS